LSKSTNGLKKNAMKVLPLEQKGFIQLSAEVSDHNLCSSAQSWSPRFREVQCSGEIINSAPVTPYYSGRLYSCAIENQHPPAGRLFALKNRDESRLSTHSSLLQQSSKLASGVCSWNCSNAIRGAIVFWAKIFILRPSTCSAWFLGKQSCAS
jgi:hypothetical protein